jgi:hypothetical protein
MQTGRTAGEGYRKGIARHFNIRADTVRVAA